MKRQILTTAVVPLLATVLPGAVAAPTAVGGTPDRAAVVANGALATNGQILPIEGEPRVPPWSPEDVGSFSPDGRAIAYNHHQIRQGPDYISLRVQQVGQAAREVWSDVGLILHQPAWSPDGTTLAVATEPFGVDSGRTRVWLVPADGSAEPTPVLEGRPGEFEHLAWTPDGSGLTYTRYRSDLFGYDLASGTSRQLTDQCTWPQVGSPGPLGECAEPFRWWERFSYAPDGSSIAASWGERVVLLDPATGDVERTLVAIAGRRVWAQSAVWSPDGTEVAYGWMTVRTQSSAVVPAAGGAARALADSVVGSWQACAGTCPEFGTPRVASRITADVRPSSASIPVSGRVRPTPKHAYYRTEHVRLTLQARRGGRWTKVATRNRPLDDRDFTFATSFPRPGVDSCRLVVRYPGGWYLTGSAKRVRFGC